MFTVEMNTEVQIICVRDWLVAKRPQLQRLQFYDGSV
uniref:Uncharacterized protein n=1 Tax=Anguilla anguilla TaxID=7936 RepID=A0A0E9T735_ANGAN